MDKKGWLNEDRTPRTITDKKLEKQGWDLNYDRQVVQGYRIRYTPETNEEINDHWFDCLFVDKQARVKGEDLRIRDSNLFKVFRLRT